MQLDTLEQAVRAALKKAPRSPLTVLSDGSIALGAEHRHAVQTLREKRVGDLRDDPPDDDILRPWL